MDRSRVDLHLQIVVVVLCQICLYSRKNRSILNEIYRDQSYESKSFQKFFMFLDLIVKKHVVLLYFEGGVLRTTSIL